MTELENYEKVTDVIVFNAPPDSVKSITLELPLGENITGLEDLGTELIVIPRERWEYNHKKSRFIEI